MKKCSFCKLSKSVDLFSKRAASRDGLRGQCKQCDSDRDKKRYSDNRQQELNRSKLYYLKNSEERRAYAQKRRKQNPEIIASGIRRRRARMKGSMTERYTLNDVINTHGTLCHLCGLEIDMSAPRRIGFPGWEFGLHLDHDRTIASGGPDSLDNVKPSHGICNLKKPKIR